MPVVSRYVRLEMPQKTLPFFTLRMGRKSYDPLTVDNLGDREGERRSTRWVDLFLRARFSACWCFAFLTPPHKHKPLSRDPRPPEQFTVL